MSLPVSASPRVLHQDRESLPPHGAEWIIDAAGCAPELLSDIRAMQRLCDAVVDVARLQVVGAPVWHQFDGPGGVTGLYLLSESHLTCHTFPEFGLASLNLYCCRRREPCDWQSLLREQLRASHVAVREVARGISGGGTA